MLAGIQVLSDLQVPPVFPSMLDVTETDDVLLFILDLRCCAGANADDDRTRVAGSPKKDWWRGSLGEMGEDVDKPATGSE